MNSQRSKGRGGGVSKRGRGGKVRGGSGGGRGGQSGRNVGTGPVIVVNFDPPPRKDDLPSSTGLSAKRVEQLREIVASRGVLRYAEGRLALIVRSGRQEESRGEMNMLIRWYSDVAAIETMENGNDLNYCMFVYSLNKLTEMMKEKPETAEFFYGEDLMIP